MASAGTVTLNLDANSVKLLRELQRTETRSRRTAGRMAQDFRRSFTRIAKAAAVMATAVAGATAAIVRSQSRQIDELGKTSDAIGVTVQNMQALRHVADLTGSSAQQLSTNIERMQRRLGQLARDGGGPAGKALEEIGISIRDIISLPADQKMESLARALSGVENAAIRTSIANDLFGRDGVRMLKLMDQLANRGLAGVREELDALGFTLTREGVAKVEQMNDSVTRLGRVSSGIGQQLTVALATPIAAIAESLTEAAIESKGFEQNIQDAVKAATDGFAKFLEATANVVDAIERMPQTAQFGLMGLLIFGKKGALIGTAIGATLDALDREGLKRVRELESRLKIQRRRLEDALEVKVDPSFMAKALNAIGLGADSLIAKARTEIPILERQLAEAVASLPSADLAILEGTEPDVNRVSSALRGVAEALRNVAHTSEEATEGLDALGKGSAPITIIDPEHLREAQAMFDRTRKSIERVEEQMRRTKELMDSGVFDELGLNGEEVLSRLQEQLDTLNEKTDQMSEFSRQAARNIQTSFADFLFNPFEDGLKGMLKSFVNTLRRMVAEAAAANILGSIGGALAGSANPILGAIGGFFGGARAAGGPVTGGKAYLVGERGPELVVPGSSGTVVPNNAMGGLNQTINIPLAFPQELEAYVRNVAGPAGRDAAMQIMRAQGGRF